jgi:hypothetical protein
MGPCINRGLLSEECDPRNQANDKEAASKPNSRRTSSADYLSTHKFVECWIGLLWLLIDKAQFTCKLKSFLSPPAATACSFAVWKKITTP